MVNFILRLCLITVLIFPLLSSNLYAKSQQEQIEELKRMVEENQRQNEKLMRKIQNLEAEQTQEKLKVEEVMSKQEAKDEKEEGIIQFFESIDLGFYVDTTYQYVFDRDSGEDITDGSRPLYQDNNSFSLNAFTITLAKEPVLEGEIMDLFGFRADVLLGSQAELISSSGFGDEDDNIDIYQGYINLLIPAGESGINFYAGKFVTLAGFEVIEAKNNPNVTRSWLFGNAIPFTHTGIRASTSAGPLDFTLGLNNGWDNTEDDNGAKTLEAQIALNFGSGSISDGWLGVTGYFGEEEDGEDGDDELRSLITVVGTMTLMEKLTLTVDADFGWEDDVVLPGDTIDDAFWWGIAGYAVVDIHPAFTFALRGEYFDDQDGFRLGVEDGIAVYELTPTLIVKPFKGLIAGNRFMDNMEWRFEFRWDHADEPYFVTDDGDLEEDQYGLIAQLLYWIDI